VVSTATPTPTGNGKTNEYYLTALVTDPTFAAPSGTPLNGNKLLIRVTAAGSQTIGWNPIYVGAPPTTINAETLYMEYVYNSTISKWEYQEKGSSGGGGHTIVDKSNNQLTQRTKLKIFQETADDAGNDATKIYPTFTKAGFLGEYDNGNSGASKTIDWNNGQNQKITLTADCTLTFTALSDINASTFRTQLKVIQDGTGGWNLFFPVGTVFCNGAFDFSTGAASQTCLVGIYYDGTKYYVIPTLYF